MRWLLSLLCNDAECLCRSFIVKQIWHFQILLWMWRISLLSCLIAVIRWIVHFWFDTGMAASSSGSQCSTSVLPSCPLWFNTNTSKIAAQGYPVIQFQTLGQTQLVRWHHYWVDLNLLEVKFAVCLLSGRRSAVLDIVMIILNKVTNTFIFIFICCSQSKSRLQHSLEKTQQYTSHCGIYSIIHVKKYKFYYFFIQYTSHCAIYSIIFLVKVGYWTLPWLVHWLIHPCFFR